MPWNGEPVPELCVRFLKKLMLEVMYEAPSAEGFSSVTIDREVVEGEHPPEVVSEEEPDEEVTDKKAAA